MSQYRTHTAIVMMDTRPAQLAADAPTAELDYPQLAFELNRGYACQHGYDLLYLRMQAATCRHELLGERHPSYCKLAAVAEALHRGYELVAFLDSDAFFHNLTLSVPQLLSLHRGSRLGGGTSAEPAAASFGVDQPFSFGPNGGVQFWRNTADAARLLRLWWHLPGGRYHRQHDYEQHTLQWSLVQLRAFRSSIETLRLQSMATALDERGNPNPNPDPNPNPNPKPNPNPNPNPNPFPNPSQASRASPSWPRSSAGSRSSRSSSPRATR